MPSRPTNGSSANGSRGVQAPHGCRKRGTTLKAARSSLHPPARLFATRSPVPLQGRSLRRKSLSILSVVYKIRRTSPGKAQNRMTSPQARRQLWPTAGDLAASGAILEGGERGPADPGQGDGDRAKFLPVR